MDASTHSIAAAQALASAAISADVSSRKRKRNIQQTNNDFTLEKHPKRQRLQASDRNDNAAKTADLAMTSGDVVGKCTSDFFPPQRTNVFPSDIYSKIDTITTKWPAPTQGQKKALSRLLANGWFSLSCASFDTLTMSARIPEDVSEIPMPTAPSGQNSKCPVDFTHHTLACLSPDEIQACVEDHIGTVLRYAQTNLKIDGWIDLHGLTTRDPFNV